MYFKIALCTILFTVSAFAQTSPKKLFPIVSENKLGYIDSTARLIIPMIFLAEKYQVAESGFSGKPMYEYSADNSEFSDGIARVRVPLKFWIFTIGSNPVLIDETGAIVARTEYDWIGEYSDGLAAVQVKVADRDFGYVNRYSYLNKRGERAFDTLTFEWAGGFSDSLAAFLKYGKYGFINTKNQVVIEPQFDNVGKFKNKMAPVLRDGKYGYIDKTGTLIIPPKFEFAREFSEDGYAVVMDKGKFGFIDKDGFYFVQPRFDDAGSFSEGMAKVVLNGKTGFVNGSGNLVVEPQFEDAGNYSGGFAPVKKQGKWGYIDTKGNLIVNPQFTSARNFVSGIAQVGIQGKMAYINKNGEVIWREE